MTNPSFTPALQRLHWLAWQPGATMHDDWWPHLGLDAWLETYHRLPSCRAAIDRLIVARRGYPKAALRASLDADEMMLMSIEPRIDTLIIALGLVALDCAEHLLVRPYREQLAARVGERGCTQLLALHAGWRSASRVAEPERLVDVATAAGTRWLQRDLASCLVATIVASRLPPYDDVADALPLPATGSALGMLEKIGRYL